jgi:hypothetical protein
MIARLAFRTHCPLGFTAPTSHSPSIPSRRFYTASGACRHSARSELCPRAIDQQPETYVHLGTSIVTALIVAKMIMVGGWLNLGGRSSEDEPLFRRTLYRSLINTVFIIAFAIIEKTVEGLIHGRSVGESMLHRRAAEG